MNATDIELEQHDVTVITGSDLDASRPSFVLRTVWFTCPCGKRQPLFLTSGAHFTLPTGTNVWHYEVRNERLTITPSIGLNQVTGHTEACHLVITDQPFKWTSS